MRLSLLLLAAALAGCGKGFSPSFTPAEKVMLAVWTNYSATPQEKVIAVMRCYTNGTPVSLIAVTLGQSYSKVIPYSAFNVDNSPVHCWLDYTNQGVSIGSSATVPDDPLTGKFTGARYVTKVTAITNFLTISNTTSPK